FVNAKPVYFPLMADNRKWASDNGGSTSYKTAAYRDKDGSLGGGPNSYVLINDGVNDSIAVDAAACEIKPTWNAAVCKGDVGRLSFGGAGGFGGARGAAPGRGAAAGPGAPGGRFGAPAGPPQPPVVLSRNGRDFSIPGATTVRAGTEIKVITERPSVTLTLTELDRGSWVIFQLPGFTTAADGAPQDSLDALRKASETSYFKEKDALWVKVVSNGDPGNGAPGGGTSLQVSR